MITAEEAAALADAAAARNLAQAEKDAQRALPDVLAVIEVEARKGERRFQLDALSGPLRFCDSTATLCVRNELEELGYRCNTEYDGHRLNIEW